MDANLAVRAEPGPAAGGAAAQPALVSPEPPPQNRLQRPLQLEGCRCVGALAIATATTFLVRAGPWPGAVRAALWRLRLRADEEKSRLKPKFGQDTSSD